MTYRSRNLFDIITQSWTFQHMNTGALSVFSFIFLLCGIGATYLGIHGRFIPSLLGGPLLSIIGIVLFVKARSKWLTARDRKRKPKTQQPM